MNHFAVSARSALLLALALTVNSCTWKSQKIPEQPVVKVNDTQLTLKEYAERLSHYLKNFDAVVARSPQQIQRARDAIVRKFILDCLLEDHAAKNNIALTPTELKDEINQIRSGYPDDIAFRKVLAEENVAVSEWIDMVRHTVIKKKVFQALDAKITKPSEEELKKYYEENKDRFRYKERILLRQIVLDDMGKAQDVLEELKKKRQDFADLAKKFSIAPERKNGGLVGWVERGSVDIFEKAFSVAVNTTSAVVESPFGQHIFKVEKKEPAGVKKFEDVRTLVDQLVMSQREQKEYTQWLDQQVRASKVWVNYELINQVKVETRVQE